MATPQEKARSEATFQYTVKNFSMMEDCEVSPPCYVRHLPWKIVVEPSDIQTQERPKFLGFYLQCNMESDSDSWRCYAEAELRLLSHKKGQKPFSRSFRNQSFSKQENTRGWNNFVTWQEVLKVGRGYIKDDSITLEVHVVAEIYEERIHRILTETKQEMIRIEQSMNQRHQEVVEKIKMLKCDADKREQRRKTISEKKKNQIFEETKQEMGRVELNMKQWKQEIVEKIEMLRADVSKETRKRKVREPMMQRDEKKRKEEKAEVVESE